MAVTGHHIGSIFKVQAWTLTPGYGTDRLSRNVGNYQSMLRNIAQEQRSPTSCYAAFLQVIPPIVLITGVAPPRVRTIYTYVYVPHVCPSSAKREVHKNTTILMRGKKV